jgi:hypothetical protein
MTTQIVWDAYYCLNAVMTWEFIRKPLGRAYQRTRKGYRLARAVLRVHRAEKLMEARQTKCRAAVALLGIEGWENV